MKVILAGLPKTGTKTMVAALHEVGYNVYDYMENFEYLGDDWMRICTKGGSTKDFIRMYQGVDACTDSPVWYFWEELLKAFPDAKVILTKREDEEEWFRSFVAQTKSLPLFLFKILRKLSPTIHKFVSYAEVCGYAVFKQPPFPQKGMFDEVSSPNKSLLLKLYRRHNSYVCRTAPKDRLLVYSVKEGWKPLCKFLEVEVPSKLFPHKNKNAELTDEIMKSHPVFARAKREVIVSTVTLGMLIAYCCYKTAKASALSKVFLYCSNAVTQFSPKPFWK